MLLEYATVSTISGLPPVGVIGAVDARLVTYHAVKAVGNLLDRVQADGTRHAVPFAVRMVTVV